MDGILRISFLNNFRDLVQPTDTFTIATADSPTTGTIDNLINGRVTTADGRGSFAVTFANGGNDLQLSDFQTLPVTLASWLIQNNLTGNDALPTADIDFDGLDNLLEYALGLDPRSADGAVGEAGKVDVSGLFYATLTYERPSGSETRSDIIYTGERSTTLQPISWDANTVIEHSVLPSGLELFETVTLRSTVSMDAPGNQPEFLHLRVTQDP